MFGSVVAWRNRSNPMTSNVGRAFGLPMSALLSQALIAFMIEFERDIASKRNDSCESLPMYSNVVRLLSEEGLPMRQLRARSGISNPAMSVLVKLLERYGWVVVATYPANSRTKLVRLTRQGRENGDECRRILAVAEQRWKAQFGGKTIRQLRESLEDLVGHLGAELPHFPVAMAHRGGTPTGL
jgi:DNA-binding MarR family transcriptional regulator